MVSSALRCRAKAQAGNRRRWGWITWSVRSLPRLCFCDERASPTRGCCATLCAQHLTWLKSDPDLPGGTCTTNNIIARTGNVHGPVVWGSQGLGGWGAEGGVVPEPQEIVCVSGPWKTPAAFTTPDVPFRVCPLTTVGAGPLMRGRGRWEPFGPRILWKRCLCSQFGQQ